MSQQTSRRLWCFLEGDPQPYNVFDIPIDANVYELKALIIQKINRLKDIESVRLKLLKLNETVLIGPDHSLAQRVADLGDIAMCSKELSSEEEMWELFPEPPSRKHLHIVVQIYNCVLNGETSIEFKLSKHDDVTCRLDFPEHPTWKALSTPISKIYNIPADSVAVSYVDSDGDQVTLNTEEELSRFLTSSQGIIKFIVQDLSSLRPQAGNATLSDSSLSAARKRLPGDDDDREAKRQKIEEVSERQNKLGGMPDIQTRCVVIHEAIKAMSDNLDLSNPSTFTTLPFPSLLSMPCQRFEKKEIDGIDCFQYMGRSHFRKLQERVENKNFLDASESLYLYGTSGSGKSHLLAALVYHLVREGKRVFYIPDCSEFYLEPAETLWTALNFAFCDSDVLGTIANPYDVDTLIRFMSNHQDLYIIVDQVNALETAGVDSYSERKVEALRWLDALRFKHRYIFSASANEISNREADRKQSGISVFRIFGGMNKDETDQWFTRHSHQIPQLSAEQRQRVEYLTGCIPLLLRCLFNVNEFIELEFRNISDLYNINSDVEIFFRTKLASLDSLSKERYLAIMEACVLGELVTIDDRSLYDLRYFYTDENGIGHFTCGIAFEAMASALRRHDNALFQNDLWYAAVARSSDPIVQGFLAEQLCLSTIANKGLKAVDPRLGRMSTAIFNTQPVFTDFLSTDQKVRLYVPAAHNFRAVDGVILLLDHASNQATMFSIQFTLSQNHKQSDKEFHTRLWPRWIEPITSAGFTLKSTFVWIDKKQPSEHVEPKLVKVLRSGDKVVHPEYSVVHVGVEAVDLRLASALGIRQ